MSEILAKISSYNLFNYLVPGVLFAILSERITKFKILQSDLIVGFFIYYVLGLTISRIGSLILEPLLKRWVKFADYKDFVTASSKDIMIVTLSESNNMYRTLATAFICLFALKLFEWILHITGISGEGPEYILFALMFIIFLFSYKKQTSYIKKRVEVSK